MMSLELFGIKLDLGRLAWRGGSRDPLVAPRKVPDSQAQSAGSTAFAGTGSILASRLPAIFATANSVSRKEDVVDPARMASQVRLYGWALDGIRNRMESVEATSLALVPDRETHKLLFQTLLDEVWQIVDRYKREHRETTDQLDNKLASCISTLIARIHIVDGDPFFRMSFARNVSDILGATNMLSSSSRKRDLIERLMAEGAPFKWAHFESGCERFVDKVIDSTRRLNAADASHVLDALMRCLENSDRVNRYDLTFELSRRVRDAKADSAHNAATW
jgi:hypothetical protein